MSSRRFDSLPEEEVVVDWSIVAVGGGIALFGVIAAATILTWMYLTAPDPVDPIVAAAPLERIASTTDSTPTAPVYQQIVQQVEKTRAEGVWAVPATELPAPLPKLKKYTPPPLPQARPAPNLRALIPEPATKLTKRARRGEAELTKLAATAPALDLMDKDTTKKLMATLAACTAAKNKEVSAELEKLMKQDKLCGLPMQDRSSCELGRSLATNMAEFAGYLRPQVPDVYGKAPKKDAQRSRLRGNFQPELDSTRFWLNSSIVDSAAPALVQIVQAEDKEYRHKLVKTLGLSSTSIGAAALTQRALFDFDAEVRQAAVELLKKRPPEENRRELLAGLRYPWAPVADHAADALVGLHDVAAIPELIDMLDLPDPAAPYQRGLSWVQPELVRINHLRNCLLCHVPFDGYSPLRGRIPVPDEAIPTSEYYQGRDGTYVRADITLLRQDFSIRLKESNHGKWPEWQRYDFVVRQRRLSEKEVQQRQPAALDYPQRDAVLHVLRGLLGVDAGPDSGAWREWITRYPELQRK
ncbi:MAG: hypothetical protein AB7K24_00650 [Gemmataceae bacterium]